MSYSAKNFAALCETVQTHIKGKCKVNHAPQESVAGAHLCSPGLGPVGSEPLMSVMHGHCDARATFPAARHHRLLPGTKLYCLMTEARVLTTCPGLHSTAGLHRDKKIRNSRRLILCMLSTQNLTALSLSQSHRLPM